MRWSQKPAPAFSPPGCLNRPAVRGPFSRPPPVVPDRPAPGGGFSVAAAVGAPPGHSPLADRLAGAAIAAPPLSRPGMGFGAWVGVDGRRAGLGPVWAPAIA